ncbi:MAG: SMR family transporter [Paracoccaceae bacterium]
MLGWWTYISLSIAIGLEVLGTTALARSDGLSRLAPSLICLVSYALAFYLLTFALRVMPTGVVYAIWSGVGIVMISAVAWLWYGQKLDLPAIIGLSFIITGVVIVNLFSKSLVH